MKKLTKLKNMILVSIILILGILSINTTSNAKDYGSNVNVSVDDLKIDDKFYLSYNEYQSNINKLLCMEHGEILNFNSQTYTVKNIITIEGDTATGIKNGKTYELTPKKDENIGWNARLAAGIYYTTGTNRRQAIWYYLFNWVKHIGHNFDNISMALVNDNNDGLAKSIRTKVENYVKKVKKEDVGKDAYAEANETEVKAQVYELDNNYIKVGPFNFDFYPELKSMTVKGNTYANNETIDLTDDIKFEQDENVFTDVSKLESSVNFYILIPKELQVNEITKIKVKTQETTPMKTITAKIAFLKAGTGAEAYQNLCLVETATEPGEKEDAEFTYPDIIPTTGDVLIEKVDQKNNNIKLIGVGFNLYHKQLELWVKEEPSGTISYVEEQDDATTFYTYNQGQTRIKGLLLGSYEFVETIQPNYGYECKNNDFEITENSIDTVQWTVPNEQVYVRLSGYVWVDEATDKTGDANKRNNLYDSGDTLLDGITVRLKDRTTGEIIKETKTANGGAYLFTDVLIEKLKDYYIEFEYDGLTYTNVVADINKDNGSKSAEKKEDRTIFNQNFSVVEGNSRNTGYTRDTSGNIVHNLSYTIDETGHTATFNNNGQYTIMADTDQTDYSIQAHYTIGQEEIKYINLGLYKREQPDIALVNDIQNVRLTINGYEHTYTYAQRFINAGEYGDGFNVGVKFGNKYGSMSYSRAIYKSDYDYMNENDKSKELQVYITYQIAMRNESSNLTSQVNSIVDYYDKNYQIVSVGTSLDEKGNTTGDIAHLDEGELVGNIIIDENYSNENYKKIIISNNTKITSQTQESIYIQFKLSREQVATILHDKNEGEVADELLHNVAEINSYSIYDGNTIYAGIDTDSNPGNCVPGDTSTYEDDTDSSPALQLEVAAEREINGKVFLDSTSNELMTGKVRQGSGAYEEGETGIEGVEVTLTENTGTGKVYTGQTDKNGDFNISGYIPGEYTLTYTWGDETYTVQNYKGTIYDSSRNQDDKNWYKENVETRLTDAIDNYDTDQEAPKGSRLQIDEEILTLNKDTNSQITRTKMDSTTSTMGIGIEKETDGNTKYGITSIETEMDGDKFVPKDFKINNIDFGIVERARQDLALTKRIRSMKVTLANGQVIVDLTIDQDGNITGDHKNITYMKPDVNTIPSNGFIRLELDNELIQGTTLKIEYVIIATNQSELDYKSEKFYKYGIEEGEKVTIEPTGIIDYLDKDWAFDTEENPQWEIKTLEEIQTLNLVSDVVYNNENSTIANKTILYTKALKGKQIEPNKSEEVTINVSKKLTTTDEISLDNETEVVEVNKTGGAKLQSTPGNYIPGSGKTETDDSMAETTIVTPATGENQNYILPIIIGVTAFIILGAGVIIIKKKVLTK